MRPPVASKPSTEEPNVCTGQLVLLRMTLVLLTCVQDVATLVDDFELFDELLALLAFVLDDCNAELVFAGAVEFEDPHAANINEARQSKEICFMCRR